MGGPPGAALPRSLDLTSGQTQAFTLHHVPLLCIWIQLEKGSPPLHQGSTSAEEHQGSTSSLLCTVCRMGPDLCTSGRATTPPTAPGWRALPLTSLLQLTFTALEVSAVRCLSVPGAALPSTSAILLLWSSSATGGATRHGSWRRITARPCWTYSDGGRWAGSWGKLSLQGMWA